MNIVAIGAASSQQGQLGSTSPTQDLGGVDSDDDGVTDLLELAYGSNPIDANSTPLNVSDDDSDGLYSWQDNCPNVTNFDQADTDVDGVGDACDDDIDGDGVLNQDDAFPNDSNESSDSIMMALVITLITVLMFQIQIKQILMAMERVMPVRYQKNLCRYSHFGRVFYWLQF